MKTAKVKCVAIVENGRINLLIRKKDPGYDVVAKTVKAIKKGVFVSWYGDTEDEYGVAQCGLVLTFDTK
jgi:hypothetical protein